MKNKNLILSISGGEGKDSSLVSVMSPSISNEVDRYSTMIYVSAFVKE